MKIAVLLPLVQEMQRSLAREVFQITPSLERETERHRWLALVTSFIPSNVVIRHVNSSMTRLWRKD